MNHPLTQAVLAAVLCVSAVFCLFWMMPVFALEWLRAYTKTRNTQTGD